MPVNEYDSSRWTRTLGYIVRPRNAGGRNGEWKLVIKYKTRNGEWDEVFSNDARYKEYRGASLLYPSKEKAEEASARTSRTR